METLKDILPADLVQIGSVEICYVPAWSQICHAQYALLTHVGDLLCLQLHTGCDFRALLRLLWGSPL